LTLFEKGGLMSPPNGNSRKSLKTLPTADEYRSKRREVHISRSKKRREAELKKSRKEKLDVQELILLVNYVSDRLKYVPNIKRTTSGEKRLRVCRRRSLIYRDNELLSNFVHSLETKAGQCGEHAYNLILGILASEHVPPGTLVALIVAEWQDDNHAFVRVVCPDGYYWEVNKGETITEIYLDAWGKKWLENKKEDAGSGVYTKKGMELLLNKMEQEWGIIKKIMVWKEIEHEGIKVLNVVESVGQ
jgi:hypothetical protein